MFSFKSLAASAAISLGLASAACATTTDYSGTGYEGSLTGSLVAPGDPFTGTATINVWDWSSFGSDFFNTAGQGELSFLLQNDTDQDANVTVVATTILQLGTYFGSYLVDDEASFSGVKIFLGAFGTEEVAHISSATTIFADTLSIFIGAYGSAYLNFWYGNPTGGTEYSKADIDFTVGVVPLPAGGLLLLSALGGLGLVRRRREKVALA